MLEEFFNIREHVILASYRRALPRGSRDEESARLRLHVKHWIPKANGSPQSGDATIIFAHGVGSSKESYEVFFEHLVQQYPRIRGIFAMDMAHHGQSYMLNKAVIGDEPGWHDGARDVVHMMNSLQDEMRPPILGVSQSFGGAHLLMASEMHPRLFDGLILIEPPLGTRYKKVRDRRTPWMMQRADWWPSREAAREALLKLKYYQRFDPRVFQRVMEYDVRDVTPDDPPFDGLEGGPSSRIGLGVTLTTPKAQEVYTMMLDHCELPGHCREATEAFSSIPGFYRPEVISVEKLLPHVYPPVLYVWGEFSDIAHKLPAGPEYREYLLHTTGASHLGSGGSSKGKVFELWVKNSTHTVPFEKPEDLAKTLVPWLEQRREEWLEEHDRTRKREFHTAKINPSWFAKVSKL